MIIICCISTTADSVVGISLAQLCPNTALSGISNKVNKMLIFNFFMAQQFILYQLFPLQKYTFFSKYKLFFAQGGLC